LTRGGGCTRLPAASHITLKETLMSATLLALLLAALTLASTQSKGINPVQHSEGATTTTTSKGINPVQHSE
jgi:hypothetical protein